MNVEIGTEAAQFSEKKYINVIFLAVWERRCKEKSPYKYGKIWGKRSQEIRGNCTVKNPRGMLVGQSAHTFSSEIKNPP
jgi:hypothetical protein